MNAGLFISDTAFAALSPDVQKQLLQVLLNGSADVEMAETDADYPTDDEEPAALSPKQVRKLVEGCGAKTKTALRLISETQGDVSLAKLTAQMEAEPGALKNVWSGLTKRVRTVTGSDTAVLIEWQEVGDGEDWTGRMAAETREALSQLFNKSDD